MHEILECLCLIIPYCGMLSNHSGRLVDRLPYSYEVSMLDASFGATSPFALKS